MATVGEKTERKAGDGAPSRPVRRVPARTLESELGFRLGRVHRALRDAWGAQLVDLGVTPPQALMLRAVCEQPGAGIRELGRRTHTDAMNAKRLADHLERTGLVESVTDPGHRQRRVLRPTDAGAVLAAEVSARAALWNQHLVRQLGPNDLQLLRLLLDRLEEAVTVSPDPGSGRSS